MRPRQLRCGYCGTRQDVVLGEGDERLLEKQGHLERACRPCGGTTRWEPYEPVAGRFADRDDEPRESPPAEESSQHPPRVLLIDDDQDILEVLGRALRNDFEVETAPSARFKVTAEAVSAATIPLRARPSRVRTR